jgi:hypothetical protein
LLNRKNAKGGRISLVIGILALALLIAGIVISYCKRGNGGSIVGIFGILAFGISIAGFVVGLRGFKEEDRNQFYSWIGSILNAGIWLFLAGTYLAFVS